MNTDGAGAAAEYIGIVGTSSDRRLITEHTDNHVVMIHVGGGVIVVDIN